MTARCWYHDVPPLAVCAPGGIHRYGYSIRLEGRALQGWIFAGDALEAARRAIAQEAQRETVSRALAATILPRDVWVTHNCQCQEVTP
jgi:hypothetical protein